MSKHLLLAICSLLWLAGCAHVQDAPGPVYSRVGQGSPTVVLQAGYGDGQAVWQPLLTELSRDFSVFAYDRPGRGANPDTDAPRDPCSIAAEQRALLQAAGLRPPYLLVGHSLGGLYQYAFAKLYPDEVAGFVLIDPTHPRHWEELKQNSPVLAALLGKLIAVKPGRAQRGEFEQQSACLERLNMAQALPVSGQVLVSRRYKEVERDFAPAVQKLQADWRVMTGVRGLDVVWDSGHYIQAEKPQRVIAAIRQVGGVASSPLPPTPLSVGADGKLTLRPGVTAQSDVRAVLGEPDETHADAEHAIWIYGRGALKVPLLVSVIPLLGDIADALELAQHAQDRYETIIQFDARGLVTEARRRKIED